MPGKTNSGNSQQEISEKYQRIHEVTQLKVVIGITE
jgi:hypothetical protein